MMPPWLLLGHEVRLAWPHALWLLFLIPWWWFLYAKTEHRKWQNAMTFSQVGLIRTLKLQSSGWRRLIDPMLLSLLMACLIVAVARPMMVARVPVRSLDVMLVMDISLSMMADDIPPDRISAARDAAIQFVETLPEEGRVGLAVFAGDTYVLSPPTQNHEEVVAYLRQLKKEDLKTQTQIGDAIQAATMVMVPKSERTGKGAKPPQRIIVLLSDGDSHEGYPWELASQEARAANVVIHTVGIGHDVETTIQYQPPSPPGATFEYPEMELPVRFSENNLRRIAELAGGQYFRVAERNDFRKVYDHIRERAVHYEQRSVDMAYWLAAVALVLVFGLSLRRRTL